MSISARLNKIVLLLAVSCLLIGCEQKVDQRQSEIAVANSYLYSVVKDLCGEGQEVLALVPPGMCPGHFDISPSQVNELCNCKVLLLFDFQKNIETVMPRVKERGLEICTIEPGEGLCLPETYLEIVIQVAAVLSERYPEKKEVYEARAQAIQKRVSDLGLEVSEKVKPLAGAEVIVSIRQAQFAKWLGFEVVSTLAGRDSATPGQINESLQQGKKGNVRLVVANKQEGTELADALATRLGAKMVVLSNFPTGRFDELVRDNLDNLLKAVE